MKFGASKSKQPAAPVDESSPVPGHLRKAGLKVTTPRIKVLAILAANPERHVSAEDVYRELLVTGEDVGLATIYRVLTQFETAGLVKRLHFDANQSVFELDAGDHHDHLLCVQCGTIVEFYDDAIERRQQAVAEANGFVLQDHSMLLYGVCSDPECRRSAGLIS